MTTSIIKMIIINMIIMIFTHLCNFSTTMSSSSSSSNSNQTIPSNTLSLISNAKHLVVFIGAGASASSGLATFRGVGALAGAAQVREDALDAVFPNVTHRAVAELVRCGRVKFVVSSNHDNLSGKGGCPAHRARRAVWQCVCGKVSQMQYGDASIHCHSDAPASLRALRRWAVGQGRRALWTIGPRRACSSKRSAAMKLCDVALVLGSGMHTNPFADLALRSPNVVVVNLGATLAPMVAAHVTKVESDTDSFMQALCDSHCTIDVPRFRVSPTAFAAAGETADSNDEEIELYVIAGARQARGGDVC
jgi:NAD-dependent SIR2 family protein deacetylase